MKSIFDKTAYEEILTRVEQLNEQSERQWGKMTVGQMVWHCQMPLNLAIKNKATAKKGNPLIRWFFKKSLYNDTPWRKNLPTVPIAKAKGDKNFTHERENLVKMIKDLYELKDRKIWNPHPMFGAFTPEQWGKLEYKHLDHHLRQFGV